MGCENQIRQHLPNFFSQLDFDRQEVEFNTTEELLNIDFVKSWSQDKDFYRYSMSEETLMVELNGGKNFYVLGYIKRPHRVKLPKFKEEG